MATVTGLAAFYFFFMSIIGLFKYLKYKSKKQSTGMITGVSGPQKVSNNEIKYVYDVNIDGIQYKYSVSQPKGGDPTLQINTPIECVINETAKTVISADDLKLLKKNLYMNPIYCVGAILITVLLIFIASSL